MKTCYIHAKTVRFPVSLAQVDVIFMTCRCLVWGACSQTRFRPALFVPRLAHFTKLHNSSLRSVFLRKFLRTNRGSPPISLLAKIGNFGERRAKQLAMGNSRKCTGQPVKSRPCVSDLGVLKRTKKKNEHQSSVLCVNLPLPLSTKKLCKIGRRWEGVLTAPRFFGWQLPGTPCQAICGFFPSLHFIINPPKYSHVCVCISHSLAT